MRQLTAYLPPAQAEALSDYEDEFVDASSWGRWNDEEDDIAFVFQPGSEMLVLRGVNRKMTLWKRERLASKRIRLNTRFIY